MHPSEEPSRSGDFVLTSITVAFTAPNRAMRPFGLTEVAFFDIDVPALISDRPLHNEAAFSYVLQAIAQGISEQFCNLEVRVPTAWRASLSLASDGSAIHRSWMARSRMVQSSR